MEGENNSSSNQSFGQSSEIPQPSPPILKGRYRHLSILPSVFTSLNLMCGFFSIIFTSQEEFLWAGWMIILAVICDILDGRIARFTSLISRFGAELDSLADMVSFGVAPAFLVFTRYLADFYFIGLFSTFIFVLCGALRLARFNIAPPSTKDAFEGLPIPAGAGILSTLTIFEMQFLNFFRFPDSFIPLLVIGTSFLMVSKVEYPSMKKSKKTSKKRQVFVLFFIIALIALPAITLFLFSWGYAIYGLLMYFIRKLVGLFRVGKPDSATQPVNES